MKHHHLLRMFIMALAMLAMQVTVVFHTNAQTVKLWAKLSNGTLTFTYGAKPTDPPAPVKCSNCGRMIAVAHKFCPNCGTAKPSEQANVLEVPLNHSEHLSPWDKWSGEIKQVVIAQSFKHVLNITSMSHWFYCFSNLTKITGLENLNTSKVTNMDHMFWLNRELSSLNLSSFDTRNVTTMKYMFEGCENLTSLNLSSFNTSKVTDMNSMFSGCVNLTSLNLSGFNTSKVTDMSCMFSRCKKLVSLTHIAVIIHVTA